MSHAAVRPLKWRKLGRIFDPTQFELPNHCEQFAQSPQALVFDQFVRIYFSSRERDPRNCKYLSHVCFADFTKDFREVTRVSDRTVIELGKLGCFDEHGIFPMHVVPVGDALYGYTTGWSRRASVSVETRWPRSAYDTPAWDRPVAAARSRRVARLRLVERSATMLLIVSQRSGSRKWTPRRTPPSPAGSEGGCRPRERSRGPSRPAARGSPGGAPRLRRS